MDGEIILVVVTITVIYVLCGVGFVNLIRQVRYCDDLPKVIGVIWPMGLVVCAFLSLERQIYK